MTYGDYSIYDPYDNSTSPNWHVKKEAIEAAKRMVAGGYPPEVWVIKGNYRPKTKPKGAVVVKAPKIKNPLARKSGVDYGFGVNYNEKTFNSKAAMVKWVKDNIKPNVRLQWTGKGKYYVLYYLGSDRK